MASVSASTENTGAPNAGQGSQASAPSAEFVFQEYQTDTGRGNLLGVQADMILDDYRSAETLYSKLDTYLAVGEEKGWIGPRTVAVFPELIGFYLFAALEGEAIYAAASIEEAASRILAGHGLPLPTGPTAIVRVAKRVFALKAARMASMYQQVFSRLAQRYDATIVGGSIILPEPVVSHGCLICEPDGPVRNISALFRSDGQLSPEIVKKAFPIREETLLLGVVRGSPEDLPVFATPIGNVGVAICADTWFPATYDSFRQKGARLIVGPSNYSPTLFPETRWQGYSLGPGMTTPPDVDPADTGRLTPLQAWCKYAMPGRLALEGNHALSYGMTLFSRGTFWNDRNQGGPPFVVVNGAMVSPQKEGFVPDLVNVWLD